MPLKLLLASCTAWVLWSSCLVAQAAVVQAPLGGAWLTLPGEMALCEAPGNGWHVDGSGRRVRPPTAPELQGRATFATAAPSAAACGGDKSSQLTLVATAAPPQIDPQSVVLHADMGRLEFAGKGLAGARLDFRTSKGSGHDTCVEIKTDRTRETCALSVGRDLPADPQQVRLSWTAAGGRAGTGVFSYDARGTLLDAENTEVPVAKIVLSHVFGRSRMLDLSTGEGRVQLARPEAVGGVECVGALCEMRGDSVRVHSVGLQVNQVVVRLRLSPRVSLLQGTAAIETPSETFELVRCPMSVASGPVVRNNDDALTLVRLPRVCQLDPQTLSWVMDGERLTVLQTEDTDEGLYVLLRVGRVNDEQMTLIVSHTGDRTALAVATLSTWELAPPRTALMLQGYGEIDFVPKNRAASVLVSPIERGRLEPLPLPGAYEVVEQAGEPAVRGVAGASGYTGIRLGYRPDRLPPAFANTNFATFSDPVQRPLREANLPVALGAANLGKKPIAELVCGVGEGVIERIPPGIVRHIPFSERDSCRLVIHRSRIPEDNGEQLLEINTSVSDVSGFDRGDVRSSQRLLVRHGNEPEVLWIRGARHQFDRIKVEVSHVPDESLYLISRRRYSPSPSGQWVVVTEDASVKFYATATIPASLYRFSRDPQELGSGPLSLNFGVLSRFTILSDEGRESLLGLETGVMGMGLATDRDRQLALVSGLGVSVPLGNPNQPTQAAINIHAWLAYSLGTRTGQLTNSVGEVTGLVELSPWAFVFGPSITVGNVAAFL